MAETTTSLSPFLGSFMTAIFIFSTVYTLAFYYYQGANENMTTEGLSDDATDFKSGWWGLIDSVLEIVSWISPFALVKVLFAGIMVSTPEIYEVINLLILRPVSWITSFITANYIISKIPTVSGET